VGIASKGDKPGHAFSSALEEIVNLPLGRGETIRRQIGRVHAPGEIKHKDQGILSDHNGLRCFFPSWACERKEAQNPNNEQERQGAKPAAFGPRDE
jgi:hypothetical protein